MRTFSATSLMGDTELNKDLATYINVILSIISSPDFEPIHFEVEPQMQILVFGMITESPFYRKYSINMNIVLCRSL